MPRFSTLPGELPAAPAAAPAAVPRLVRRRPEPRPSGLDRLALWMLWALVFVIPWENLIVLPELGTVSRLLGIPALGIALLAGVDQGRWRRLETAHLLMSLFVVWAALSWFWSEDQSATLRQAVTYAQLLLMVWLIWQLAAREREVLFLMKAFLLGTYVSIFQSFDAYLHHRTLYYNRYTASGFDPNDLALILALSVPMGLYLAVRTRGRLESWLYWLHPPLAVTAIFMAASRGALLAMLGTLTLLPLVVRRWTGRQKALATVALALTLIAAVKFVPAFSWRRLAGTGQELRSGTLNQRTEIWQAGWESFREKPFYGVGSGGFGQSVAQRLSSPGLLNWVAHNTFLSVLVEGGVAGFAIFGALILALFLAAGGMPPLERAVWLALMVGWAIGVAALTWEYRKPTWFIFGMLAAHAAALRRRPVVAWRGE